MPVAEVDVATLAQALRDGATLVDVREPDEFTGGHVPGAVLVPLDSLPDHTGDLPRDRRIYVICASGNRSRRGASALNQRGFDAVTVNGGTSAWMDSGRPVVTGARQS